MKQYATISGDTVNSTKMSEEDVLHYKQYLDAFFSQLESRYPGSWGRVVRGDAVEYVLPNPKDAFRVALMLKCYVKNFKLSKRNDQFCRYGMRIDFAVGALRINDKDKGIIDGDAIYASGRNLDKMHSTYSSTMNVQLQNSIYDEMAKTIVALADTIINKNTAKQSMLLYYKMLGYDTKEISEVMDVKASTISQQSSSAGWQAISMALNYFENHLELD